MFTPEVNEINGVCTRIVENVTMHASTRRLYEAVSSLTNGKLSELGEVAEYLGVTSQVLKNWETRGVSKEGRLAIYEKRWIDPQWLATGTGEMMRSNHFDEEDGIWVINKGRRPVFPQSSMERDEPDNVAPAPALKPRKGIPVVGEVKGGDDGYLDELQYPVGHGDGVVEYPTQDANAYALRVRGDSMHPRYRAGEFIVVEPSIEPQPGDDVVVSMADGRKLLKELNWRRDGDVQLLSVNNHFGPLTLPESEVQCIQLVAGRVRRSAFHKTER